LKITTDTILISWLELIGGNLLNYYVTVDLLGILWAGILGCQAGEDTDVSTMGVMAVPLKIMRKSTCSLDVFESLTIEV